MCTPSHPYAADGHPDPEFDPEFGFEPGFEPDAENLDGTGPVGDLIAAYEQVTGSRWIPSPETRSEEELEAEDRIIQFHLSRLDR